MSYADYSLLVGALLETVESSEPICCPSIEKIYRLLDYLLMVQIIDRRNENKNGRKTPGSRTSGILAAAVALAAAALGALGFPQFLDNEQPPPGTPLYRSGPYECWDKVVCCNESDESSCERIPICTEK